MITRAWLLGDLEGKDLSMVQQQGKQDNLTITSSVQLILSGITAAA